jgi:hypothetical protein
VSRAISSGRANCHRTSGDPRFFHLRILGPCPAGARVIAKNKLVDKAKN